MLLAQGTQLRSLVGEVRSCMLCGMANKREKRKFKKICSKAGEGNGNPLQYSCLENSMDRETWWATVCGVAKSQTQLSDSHRHTHKAPRISTHLNCVHVFLEEPTRQSDRKTPALALISHNKNIVSHLTYLTPSVFLCTINQLDWMILGFFPALTVFVLKNKIYMKCTLNII